MGTLRDRIVVILSSNKVGLGVVFGLAIITAVLIALPSRGYTAPQPQSQGGQRYYRSRPQIYRSREAAPHQIQLTGVLERTKVVQGDTGEVYLELSAKVPFIEAKSERKATDMVVVLDRSGSMAAKKKLPYAKAAIQELISRMNAEDRFALVTFDTAARVISHFAPMNDIERGRISSLVSLIRPGGATNLSEGIQRARDILRMSRSGRVRKVLILSDGHANQGVIDPKELASLIGTFSSQGAIVSTIGMGLGFNESLLSTLADHGMGNYSYLEHLVSLGDLLGRELEEARAVFARMSQLEVDIEDGVRVVDVGGYPMQPWRKRHHRGITVPTGQLLSGTTKTFFMTFLVPTGRVGDVPLPQIRFGYLDKQGWQEVKLDSGNPIISVVPAARRKEAYAAINEDVLIRNQAGNLFGSMLSNAHHSVQNGDREKAKRMIADYERKALAAAAHDPVLQADVQQQIAGPLQKLRKRLDKAFTGSGAGRKERLRRLSKGIKYDSRNLQRSY